MMTMLWRPATILAVVAMVANVAADEGPSPDTSPAPIAPTLQTLQSEINALKAWKEERELKDLQQDADATSLSHERDDNFAPRTFQGGERALQALNPELSVTGDIGAWFLRQDGANRSDSGRSGFFLRGLGVHLQSNLDPFSLFKAAVHLSPEGAELEEAYVTWTNLLPRTNLTVGRFRQQLGVVNRWHKHALDFFDFPLMLLEPFGPEGLNQTGMSLDVLLPSLWAHEQTVTLQVTNGSNGQAFSGDFFSIPTTLLRLRSYWDLDRGTYLDLGLTGVFGFNHGEGMPPTEAAATPLVDEARRWTAFGGADLTLAWEPPNRSHYAGLTWRTEFLYGYKQVPGDLHIAWMGGYTALDAKIGQGWFVGARGELAQPFTLDNAGHYLWQAAPYVSWWPSEFVRLHLEYNAVDGDLRALEHRLILQVVFAAGPHKHERY